MPQDVVRTSDGINLYFNDSVVLLKESGRILKSVLDRLCSEACIGNTTKNLNLLAEALILENHAEPLFKGYSGFPYATCMSNNDCVVHGFPNDEQLKEGDVLSIDVGVKYRGFCTDAARTIIIGSDPHRHKELVSMAEQAFKAGVAHAFPGNYTGDIGYAIQRKVISSYKDPSKPSLGSKFAIFPDFQGHGVGLVLHEKPSIPNYGYPKRGRQLEVGMCITIEPVILYSQTKLKRYTNSEGFLFFNTEDGTPTSHYENTIYISEQGPVILTT